MYQPAIGDTQYLGGGARGDWLKTTKGGEKDEPPGERKRQRRMRGRRRRVPWSVNLGV